MKNKKIAIIFIVIVIIVAILTGIYKIMTSYMFKNNNKEITIEDSENKLIRYLDNIENKEEKREQVELYLEANKITEQEAKEILEK